eukprot:407384-Hanusia_phi.AAC.2
MFKVKLFCDKESLKPRQDVESSEEALSCSTTPDSSLDRVNGKDRLHRHQQELVGLAMRNSRRDSSDAPFDDSAAAECLLDLSSSEQGMSDSEQELSAQGDLWLPEGGLYDALYNGITTQNLEKKKEQPGEIAIKGLMELWESVENDRIIQELCAAANVPAEEDQPVRHDRKD